MNFNGKIITALNMYGKSTQDGSPTPDSPIDIVSVTNPVVTLTGKNYFDEETAYASYSNDDGTYTTTGATFLSTRTVIPSDLLNQELTFSAYIDLTDSSITNVRVLGKENGTTVYGTSISTGNSGYSSVTFTPTASTDYIAITYGSGADYNVTVSLCQLEIGSSRTDFQDYVSEQYYIRKNLLENTASTTTTNGITFTVNSDGSITLNGTATATAAFYVQSGSTFPLLEGNYIMSGVTGGSASTYRLQMNVNINGSQSALGYCTDGDVAITVPSPDTITYFYWYIVVYSGITVDNVTIYPMIRKAEIVDDTYEAYTDVDDTLRAIPCTSGGNFTDSNGQMWYADEWDIVNGTITRYCYELTLDGSSTTGLYTYSSYSGFYLNTSELTEMLSQSYGVGFCTHLSVLSSMSDTGIVFGSSNATIYMPYLQTYLSISSVSEFATWLASNNMTIVYPLAETTEESV